VVLEGLDQLYTNLLDEMDRQKSDPQKSPAAAAKRVDTLLKMYEGSMPDLHLNAEGMGDVRPALRRASEYLSLASLAGWELRRMTKDENVRGIESEARANMLMALSEIRAALSSVGAAPWDLVKFERDVRINHIAINLAFGGLVCGLLLYLFLDIRYKELEAAEALAAAAAAPPWAVGAAPKARPADMVINLDDTMVVRSSAETLSEPPKGEGIRMPEAKPAKDKPAAQPAPGVSIDAARLLAGAAARSFHHDLTVINGYSDLLLDSLPGEDPIRSDLIAIRRAGERANVLAGQLHVFANSKPERWEQIDVNRWLESVRSRFEALLPADIQIHYDLGPAAGVVRGDPDQLEQALKSLILNASDAMPGGGTVRVHTALTEPAKGELWTSLTVSDTGRGMDAATLRRLFDSKSSPLPNRNSGIGLPSVASILEQHQGHVEVESQPGQGASFHLLLPRVSTARRSFALNRN
jgi:signal transduction histidine kinase